MKGKQARDTIPKGSVLKAWSMGPPGLSYWYRTDVGVVVNDMLLLKGPPLLLQGSPQPTRFSLPEERRLSMPEIGEKERNYLFKSYTDLE